jgi:hypothetical protein
MRIYAEDSDGVKMSNLFKDRYDVTTSPLAGGMGGMSRSRGGGMGEGGGEEPMPYPRNRGINSKSVKRDINAGLAFAAALSAGKQDGYACKETCECV